MTTLRDASRARRRTAWTRFLRSPGGLFSLAILAALVLTAILAPALLSEQADTRDFLSASQGPSREHLLGTDALGRDVLARTLVATRLSLVMAVVATAIGSGLGITLGAALALAPGRVRSVGARTLDGMLAFPSVLMGIFVAALLGPGTTSAVLGIGIALTPQFARITMNKTLSLVAEDYVRLAEVMGVPRRLVVVRHVLPNIAESIGVITLVTIGEATIAVSSLSFLGLGVRAPDYDWGQLLTDGITSFQLTPWAALAPAAMITLVGISTSLLGDAVARVLNQSAPRGPIRRRLRAAAAAVPGRATATPTDPDAVLSVRGLRVEVDTAHGVGAPVRDVSFDIAPGEMVGVVGESGSGKTMTALAVAGLRGRRTRVSGELAGAAARRRPGSATPASGDEQPIAFVFQDPMSSFNPLLRIGTQVAEGAPRGLSRAERARLVERRFADVHISAPAHRMRQFPHELSGGMRQRAMIAGALLGEPALIVADEPTTSLDVTTQAQIMTMLRQINQERSTAVLLISHDIALVSQNCQRILVMYAGRIVEELPASRVQDAAHPYTRALVAATPAMFGRAEEPLADAGPPPPVTAPDAGCAFAARCPLATEICHREIPGPTTLASGGRVACWHHDEAEVTS
ncbi:dipeptide/oligopeptide/nickel ABC transporter permease/ATP-binding protein [Nocardioides sp. LMS-CY]|uniref:dipeptide/oligopeptide/nickel ABC transporter permease/ATP-binding protein n=1 Tax=Nocardioides sp. (strain LMS-CY) TaxID=2840457 RepID=UPI001BFFDCA5|nr:dipeptide/oligopeptide/nickel ABC transporter permease/ATP-binding protein [Nocardioides sp. LMS-CY]QWF23234.1 dipeptide/oligopeptide/nickel ABC transporter permease/ATP-binding protein [Nocardioides sp. LMS-CY]